MKSGSEILREVEDPKVEQIGQILDALAIAIPYRRLVKELSDPGPDILDRYRTSMLTIYSAIEQIAQDTVDRDRSDRAYDEGR